MVEQADRTLKDTLNAAQEEGRRANNSLDQSRKAYNDLMNQYVCLNNFQHWTNIVFRFNQEKARLETDAASARQQTKVKSFECDRLRVVYEDTLASLKRLQLDNEKYLKKIELLTKEYHDLRAESTFKISTMEQNYGSGKTQAKATYMEKFAMSPLKDVDMQLTEEKAKKEALELEVTCLADNKCFDLMIRGSWKSPMIFLHRLGNRTNYCWIILKQKKWN